MSHKTRTNMIIRSLRLPVTILVLLFVPSAPIASVSPVFQISYRTVYEISGAMHLPSDVALDAAGRIYLLDGTGDIVRVFDDLGKPLFSLGGEGVLRQPLGIDVTDAGDVVVADSGNHRLALFSAGKIVPQYIELPTLPGDKPADPTDVHFSRDNDTFVAVDNDNHRVIAVGKDGKLAWSCGGMGRNPEEFRFPFMVDMDREGNVYVVEVINTRVQVLNPGGTFKRFIGEWGIEPGQFFRPKGIAVNEKREVFVSDSYLGVIQIFDYSGRFMGVVGNEHGNMMRFKTPMGMAVAADRLLVVEMFTNRLLVLERQR